MRCVIMQPTYFPWAGFFNLISQAESFIFLDDAQFSKNSWHNRNQLLSNNKRIWLTIPIKKNKLNTKIIDIQIDNSKNWKQKHIKTILQIYRKHKYYDDLDEVLSFLIKSNFDNLSSLNIDLIKLICKKLNLKTNFYNSSNLNLEGKRTDKVIQILDHFKASEYLSPKGAMEYLIKDKFEKKTSIELNFQNYLPKKYLQLNSEKFISHLSIIDVIANIGLKETTEYVKD